MRFYILPTALLAVLCVAVSCRGTERPSPPTATPSAAAAPPVAVGPQSIPAQQAPADGREEQRQRAVYDAPFDAANRLVIKTTYTSHGGSCCSTVLHVLLIDRADGTRQWEIDSISEQYEYDYEARRINSSSLVLCRTDSHGLEAGCFKLFVDPAARRLVKRVAFELRQDVAFANDSEAQRRLGVSAQDLAGLKKQMVLRATRAEADPPAAFTTHPLPQSTYAAFARARPARVKNGYREAGTKIEEKVGAWQAEDGGFWFAKTFYDGEGTTGVGAVGFLSSTGQYRWLTIPALLDWSADALLVEPDAVWAGLVNHGEGPDTPGGLLRIDRNTNRAELQEVPGVILRIVHLGDAVFLSTTRGLYVLRNDVLTWHHMEPDVSGRLVVITETVDLPGSFFERKFTAEIDEVPRLGWFVGDDQFIAPEHVPSLVLYGPADAPSSAVVVAQLTAQQVAAMRQRERVACDVQSDNGMSAYAVSPAAGARGRGQALYTSKPLPGPVRSGLVRSTLSPDQVANVVSLLKWTVPARVQRHEALGAVPGGLFYSFHRRFDTVSGILRQEAIVLHDATGRPIAHEVVTLREDDICDGCGLPDLKEGTSFLYHVLNVFEFPAFPYPVLLLDSSTFEGRATSLMTFNASGRVAHFRLYEYVMSCGAPVTQSQGAAHK